MEEEPIVNKMEEEPIVNYREEILTNVFFDIFSELLTCMGIVKEEKEALKNKLKNNELFKRDVKEMLSLIGLTRIST